MFKKEVIFISKTANLNIIKNKGATIVTAVPGGTKSEVTPTSWIKFREYKYVASDPEEIEIIRRHIEEYPSDRIVELVPKTAEDILKEKEAVVAEAMKELEKAKESVEKASEARKEEEKSNFKCPDPDCDFVGKNAKSLVAHKKFGHKDK